MAKDDFYARHTNIAGFLEDIGVPHLNDVGSVPGANDLYKGTRLVLQTDPKLVEQWAQEASDIESLIGAAISATVSTTAPVAGPALQGISANKFFAPTDEDRAAAFIVATPRGRRRMIKLKGMGIGGTDITISLEFGPAVRACVLAAKAEMGYRLVINNAFRNYDPKQSNAAQGGTSNHRTGDAVDFDIANTGVKPIDWVHRNKRRFGLMNELWKPGMPKTFEAEFNHFSVNGH